MSYPAPCIAAGTLLLFGSILLRSLMFFPCDQSSVTCFCFLPVLCYILGFVSLLFPLSSLLSLKDFFLLGFLGLVVSSVSSPETGYIFFHPSHPSSLSSCYAFAFPVQLKFFFFFKSFFSLLPQLLPSPRLQDHVLLCLSFSFTNLAYGTLSLKTFRKYLAVYEASFFLFHVFRQKKTVAGPAATSSLTQHQQLV